MRKGPWLTLALMLYVIINHPYLYKSPFILCIYYFLLLSTASFEALSIIPSKEHSKYFRRLEGETCMIGIIILPALSASFSDLWHLNFLSFSILSLLIYFSLHLAQNYLFRFSMICIITACTVCIEERFSFLLILYHFVSLLIFERIFNCLCTHFCDTFTFSDTCIVSGFLFFIFEQCAVLSIASCDFVSLNYFQNRLKLHEFHIVSILMIGFALMCSVTLIPFICKRSKSRKIHNLVFGLSIFLLFCWIDFVLNARCALFESHCIYPSLTSAIFAVVAQKNHFLILVYWLCLLLFFFAMTPIPKLTKNKNQILQRKYFHFWCLALFLPILKWQYSLYLSLALCIALFLFIFVEAMRVTDFCLFAREIEKYCRPFLDERDGGKLVLTHIWLLVGCAIPLWYSFVKEKESRIYAVSGIIILGIGDAMAAIVGRKLGKIKWPNSSKTVEGTLAGILSSLLLYMIMIEELRFDWQMTLKLTQVIAATFILEAITKQIDNLYLPLFCGLFMDVTFRS